jgi:hypothetical protein
MPFHYNLAYGLVNPNIKEYFMHHSFDTEIAVKHGVNVAIFLNNLAFWVQKNAANKKHLKEDRIWSYNSQDALLDQFPYWSRQNIRTIISYCVKNNLIIVGNFNETAYDRTGWYTFTNEGFNLFPDVKSLVNQRINAIGWNQPMEMLESTNGLVGTNQPIPDNKPYYKTYNKSSCAKRVSEEPKPDQKPKQKTFPQKTDNTKKHDWAPMANEKASIERNEVFKRVPPPSALKDLVKNLKRKGMTQ